MNDIDVFSAFFSAGNVFDCDCSLLWMNRLAAETISDQVSRAFSDAQCMMNDTADDVVGGGDVGYSTGSRTGHKTHANGGNGGDYSRMSDAKPAADVGGLSSAGAMASDGTGAGVSDGTLKAYDGTLKAYDESQLTKVSALTEDTCPGKEQPLVDVAPDAAQNSDRVLYNASGAGTRLVRSSAPLPVLLSALVFAIRRRRLC